MKKIFEKYETLICIILIDLYVVINSYCMQNFGIEVYRSKSIIPCIITYSLNNVLSIFNIENDISLSVASVFLIVVPLIYDIYINRTSKNLV